MDSVQGCLNSATPDFLKDLCRYSYCNIKNRTRYDRGTYSKSAARFVAILRRLRRVDIAVQLFVVELLCKDLHANPCRILSVGGLCPPLSGQ